MAACRFWDIAQGTPNGGEVINLDDQTGTGDTITNNAFVWSHAYNCSGAGIILYGGGMNHNTFLALTMDTRSSSIYITGFDAAIHDNTFQNIEIGADMSLDSHCYANSFNMIAANRNALRNGNGAPGYSGPFVNPNNRIIRPPFMDISTQGTGESPNTYQDLYETAPDGALKVFSFLSATAT